MSEIGYLLAAVLGKMFDPLILAAGILPPLIARRWLSLGVSALVGAALGLFVYVMSARGGSTVSLMVLPICAAASSLWWAIAVAARNYFLARRSDDR